ncbi:MAG: nucleotidyltransferase domain-containing protein [Candidatus Goldbacteria bacterium]|nr:nucleotidyltransferase domain-containing protein [Candidatus Goldiibacteriota bacterium]
MTREEIIKNTKEIIIDELKKYGYKEKEIILFGSRAKGCEKPDSDWDFYVIVDKYIDFKIKKKIIGAIQMKLAEKNIFADILINDYFTYERLKNEKTTISYITQTEGIRI